MRHPTADEKMQEIMVNLYLNTCMSYREIAENMGLSYKIVYHTIKTKGITRGEPQENPLKAAIENADKTQNGWMTRIAHDLGLSPQRVSAYYKNMLKKQIDISKDK